jgi:hypothetical protein
VGHTCATTGQPYASLQQPDLGVPVDQRQAQPLQIGMAGSDLRFDRRDLASTTVDSCGHLLAYLSDLFERAAVAFQRCVPARQTLPALHHHIHVLRIELDTIANALRGLRSRERGAATKERLVN